MFIRLSDNYYPVTQRGIKNAHPDTTFPDPFQPPEGYAPVLSSPPPAYDAATQRINAIAPVFDGTNWMQQWEVTDLTPEEIANVVVPAKYVPPEVTMRQARLALLDAQKLDAVLPAIESLPADLKAQALIEWEYSSTVARKGAMVSMLAPLLSLSDEDLDNLFIAAYSK